MKQDYTQGTADNPGGVKFSIRKYLGLRRLIGVPGLRERVLHDLTILHVAEFLWFGDTQPCMVCSIDPLLVSAYSEAFDAVVILKFPDMLVKKYRLSVGDRLVSSNIHHGNPFGEVASDIYPGPENNGYYQSFTPIVQLFLGKNDSFIRSRTELFDPELWARVEKLTDEYRKNHPDLFRDGFSYFGSVNRRAIAYRKALKKNDY